MNHKWLMHHSQRLPKMLHELQVRITALWKLNIEFVLQFLIEVTDSLLVFLREVLERLEPAGGEHKDCCYGTRSSATASVSVHCEI
jgi:hypothetical protein